MVKNGLNKIYPHAEDYSLIHTYGATIYDVNGLPENFSIFDGRTIPNQNLEDTRFTPPIRPLPYGCTGESQTLLAGLEDGAIYPPDDLYDNTPPGGEGGRDLRASLQATKDRGFKLADGSVGAKRTAYFNVYGAGAIDDFDAVRIALWINQNEKRAVTVGSWWYGEFGNTDGIVPTPSFNTKYASLHNHVITGWKTINGVLYLEDISHQGENIGDKGKLYFSREIYNALMAQPWTGAFTLSKVVGQPPIPLGFQAIIDSLVAFIQNLFNVSPMTLPPAPPEPALSFDTPKQAFHATRVMCDNAGLTFTQKNILCACVYQESGFLTNPKPNQNKDKAGKVWSTDYGIVQINDYWHIGAGKDFPSVDYVINNPDKCIQYMIDIYKRTGALTPWSSFVSGAYKKWLPLTSKMWTLV